MPRTPSPDDTIAAQPAPSETFGGGRYVVLRSLGGGSQKSVYLAHDRELERKCALAIVQPGAASGDDLLRFRREAQAMARLGSHPNIVTVYDIGVHDQRPYVVCEYVEGGDLRAELDASAGPLTVGRALSVGADVLAALAFAHERGIVHRDVKPANIWITGSGSAKLGDFGMARAADWSQLTHAGSLIGTPTYMAPEQARGEPAGPRSDLYALGCVLHEMLTGRPPFQAPDIIGVLYQHVHVPPAPAGAINPAVPRGVERLVLQLLAKEPADRPATAVEVGGALDAAPAPALSLTPSRRASGRPFVGRRAELEALRDALEQAFQGRGGLRFIVGESGIGKSRLMAEVAAEARSRGVCVLRGAAVEAEGAPPYLPWGEALCGIFDDTPRSGIVIASAERTELERVFPISRGAAPAMLGTGTDRFSAFQRAASVLVAAAAPRGLLLCLEDLHWADKPSLLMLQHLARQLHDTRILVVGTYRDTDVDRKHPLAETLAELRRERRYERVLLRGLPPEDARALVASLGDASDTLVNGIIRETEGNPFFIEELIRHVGEAGAESVLAQGLPEGVREVIGRRLSRLSEPCNRLLALAAVMGPVFRWAPVAVASGEDELRLLDLLDEALDSGVIREERDVRGSYAFTHALIRETLREELSAPRRARFHRQIAEAMERVHGANLDPHRSEIAQHFILVGTPADVTRAIPHALLAAERATRLLAVEDAIRELEALAAAIDLVGAEDRERARVLAALGAAKIRGGDSAQGQERCKEAIAIARRIGDAELEAEAAIAYGQHFSFGHVLPEMASILRHALASLPDVDSVPRARLLARLAGALQPALKPAEPCRIAFDAIAMARRVGQPEALVRVLYSGMAALMDLSLVREHLPLNQELLELSAELGEREGAFRAHLRLVFDYVELTDFRRMEEHLAACEAIALDSRHAGYEATSKMLRSMYEVAKGRFVEAERLVEEARTTAERVGERNVLRAASAQERLVRSLRREWDAFEVTRTTFDYGLDSWQDVIVYAAAERVGRAEELRPFALAIAALIDPLDYVGPNLALFAIIWVALRKQEVLPEVYDKLLVHAGDIVTWGATGMFIDAPYDRYLARVAEALGRHADTDRHFESAIALTHRLGMLPAAADLRCEWGEILLRRGGAGNEKARSLFAESKHIASGIGMDRLVARIDEQARAT